MLLTRLGLLLGIGAFALTTGCSHKEARGLATQTAQALTLYEQQLDAKIAAEHSFYRNQRRAIRERIIGASDLVGDRDQIAPFGDELPDDLIQSTLYYQSLTSSATHAAVKASDMLHDDPNPALRTATASLLNGALDHQSDLRKRLLTRDEALNRLLIDGLMKINVQRAKLKTVRSSLKSLAAEPSDSAQRDRIIELARQVAESIDGNGS